MTETERDAIRRLLKTFGIQADEAMVAHLARIAPDQPVKVRLVLQDLDGLWRFTPGAKLHLEIEGDLRP